jgi:hypothetical protein
VKEQSLTRRIAFEFGDRRFLAALTESPVAEAVWNALPFEASFSTWGEEIYFDTGISIAPSAAQETVSAGDVAYWPPGRAICLFWGPTPASGPGEIRPASAVAVFGRLEGDPAALAEASGRRVRVVRAP